MIMLADALTTISHLINSPPGQLAAGGVLAGIVWKFFERVETVLTENTKLEIAVWLVAADLTKPPKALRETMLTVFGLIFGKRQLSWRCFAASVVLTCVASAMLLPQGVTYFSKVTDAP